MCAAPGGKTTALAQLMGDTGEVIALDRSHRKARNPPITPEPRLAHTLSFAVSLRRRSRSKAAGWGGGHTLRPSDAGSCWHPLCADHRIEQSSMEPRPRLQC